MRRPTISAVLIVRDEAGNLPDCLATLGWADQVIVVIDAASADATEAIARRHADIVMVRPFDDFARQRNAAIELATTDWVFSIDADERVTPGLAAEMLAVTADPEAEPVAYRVPIRSAILGRTFRYSGTQNDRPIRLFRRGRAWWSGQVHEVLQLGGPVGEFTQPLGHRTLPDIRSFLKKLDTYTSLEARQFAAEGRPLRARDLWLRPFWTFFKLYLAREGYRDGIEGLIFCLLSGVSVLVRHWKHREMIGGTS